MVMEKVIKSKARIITWNNDEYPMLLKGIHHSPVILFAKGIPVPDIPCMTI